MDPAEPVDLLLPKAHRGHTPIGGGVEDLPEAHNAVFHDDHDGTLPDVHGADLGSTPAPTHTLPSDHAKQEGQEEHEEEEEKDERGGIRD